MIGNANDRAGFHQFNSGDDQPYGSFEVLYLDGFTSDDGDTGPGWYWWACWPGCLPDGDPSGPFATSQDAYDDALATGDV